MNCYWMLLFVFHVVTKSVIKYLFFKLVYCNFCKRLMTVNHVLMICVSVNSLYVSLRQAPAYILHCEIMDTGLMHRVIHLFSVFSLLALKTPVLNFN